MVLLPAMRGGHGLRRPDQEAADGMSFVEGIEKAAHLVAVPDVAALKFGQRHVAAVDVIKNRGDFHAAGWGLGSSNGAASELGVPCK